MERKSSWYFRKMPLDFRLLAEVIKTELEIKKRPKSRFFYVFKRIKH